MKPSSKIIVSLLAFGLILSSQTLEAQTKRLKRPSSRVGINSVDTFVQGSFNLYNKVYRYDGYAEAGKPLEDDDYEILIEAVEDAQRIAETAPNLIADLEGTNALRQAKATLQINRAKKALKYSIKTAKKLLTERRKQTETEGEKEEEIADSSSGENTSDSSSENNSSNSDQNPNAGNQSSNDPKDVKIYSKFDFVPGDKLLFFDDYSNDYIGDFPSKWNTNGSGEVVTVNDTPEKWMQILAGYNTFYVPDAKLPEEYTIEFDLLSVGLDNKTSSTARLRVVLSDDDKFNWGHNYVSASLPFGQYGAFGIRMKNYINRGGGDINNVVTADIREAVLNQPHISIAVNKLRFRLWVNEKKYVDIPRIMPTGGVISTLKFELHSFKDGKERLFIRNLKVAEGGIDLRRKLIEEGSVSTNGILFDSGSANIQPQSYGIIRQISQVLQQEVNMKLNIIGHTDSDGGDEANLELSKKRAEAVRNALMTIYKISGDRLQTDGRGESVPVGDNTTTDGKAQNRRVEFIKI